ncbi:MAG: hypothetical protein GX781_01110 [Clostridiales bacterium]|nr:hypothetical protein [Clostridiales bacterium]
MRRLILCTLIVFLLTAGGFAQSPYSLQPGSSGDAVISLQKRLILYQLLPGKADGIYGPQTKQAVRHFQEHLQKNGYDIVPDGIATPQTLLLAYDDRAAGELLNLKVGDSGSGVSELQTRLYDIRLLTTLPDGKYGDQTAQAVKEFQLLLIRSNIPKATATGVADPVTREYLFGDLMALNLRLPQTFDDSRPTSLTPDDLYAKSAILIDMQTGDVLLSKDAQTKRYPASTTKIMTLLLALEHMNMDQTVTIPGAASAVPKDSSLVPVYPGEVMPFKDLLYGLMLRSGNDAANAVAVLTSGSVESFAALMNKKAAELQMTGTAFTNPHGYHDKGHYTNAGDLAKLSLYALQNPAFRDIIAATSYAMQPTVRRPELLITVSTELFDPLSRFYYAPAFGIKSGFTRAAGFCYVGAAQKDGRLLLAVVLGGRTRNQAWTDMTRLFQSGFEIE